MRNLGATLLLRKDIYAFPVGIIYRYPTLGSFEDIYAFPVGIIYRYPTLGSFEEEVPLGNAYMFCIEAITHLSHYLSNVRI